MSGKESIASVAHDVLIKTTDPTIVKAGTPLLAIFGIPIAQLTEMVNGYGTMLTTVLGIIACIYLIIGRHLANRKAKLEAIGEHLRNEATELANKEARLRIEEMYKTSNELMEKVDNIAEAVDSSERESASDSDSGSIRVVSKNGK